MKNNLENNPASSSALAIEAWRGLITYNIVIIIIIII